MRIRTFQRLLQPFTEHPASVDETYGEHFRVAVGFARTLVVAAGAAAIHAVVPAWCEHTASRRIVELHERISTGRRAALTESLDERPADELRPVS